MNAIYQIYNHWNITVYYTSCTFYLGFLNVQLYKSVNLINENSGNTDDFFNDF